MTKTKTIAEEKKTEKEESSAIVLNFLKKGKYKTYSKIDTVARSGMSRSIHFFAAIGAGELINLTYHIAKVTGHTLNKDGALKVNGCGMDMGFNVIYNLGIDLFGRKGGYKITNTWI